MKRIFQILTLILFLQSCDNAKVSKKGLKNSKIKNTELEHEKDSIKQTAVSNNSSDNSNEADSLIRILKNLRGKRLEHISPSGWISDYYFFNNNRFIIDDKQDALLVGKWIAKSEKIILYEEKLSGKRGIGEPNNEPIHGGMPAVYIYTFDEYVNHCETKTDSVVFDYDDILKELIMNRDEGIMGFASISDIESNKMLEDFDIELYGMYSFASEKTLTEIELNQYSKDELLIIRNEIFARYGYIFKDEKLNEYFRKQNWYKPSKSNVDKYLSDVELENVKLIINLEEKE